MRMVLGALSCALVVLSCSGDELLLPAEGEPAALAIVDGDAQTGPVGGQLAAPLVVRVTDSRGRPVAGAQVAFSPGAGSVNPQLTNTDADGLATANWSLGLQTGGQELMASVNNASPPLSVRFSATASAGAARGLIIVSGSGQSAPAGTALPAPVIVRLLDEGGNPIAGGSVSWVIGQGGGRVEPGSSATGPDGTASANWTLGPGLGANTLTAVVSGVGTVQFTATGTAAAAARLLLNGGNDQTAPPQSRLPAPLSVKAVDANGNGVAGVSVAWAVTAGGGSLSTSSSVTRADGTTDVTWTLGAASGAQTATATSAGLQGSPITFTAIAAVGPASRLAIVTQPSGTVTSGVAFPQQPVIELRDASWNAVPQGDVRVTAAIASGGGTLNGATTATTNGSGRAAFTNLSITGSPGTRTIIFAADGFSSVTSSPIQVNAAGPSASQSGVSAAPASFEAGSGSSTVTITVRDAQGTLLANIPVQITVSGTGNTVNQPGSTNASGVATGSFTSTVAETKTVSATAGSVQIQQTASVTVTAPAPTADASQSSATVPNGVAGTATVIAVQARTSTGAAMTSGGDAVTVTVTGDNPAGALPVTDNGNGTYTASYTPQAAGTDQVAITLNGVPISGSPYTSTVVAAAPSQIGFLGTVTRTAVNSMATFNDLAIDRDGEYTLRATRSA